MKALVTGGAGFIGSYVSERLVAEGWQVTILDDLSNGSKKNIPAKAELLVGSADDSLLLDKVLQGCEVVFHLAAVASVVDSIARAIDVHHTNLTNTLVLLEAATRHRVRRFVFSSSAAVYGNAGNGPVREDAPKNPLSHYAVQKLASEYYCGVYHHMRGLETVCLRYFNVFGDRQRIDSPYTGVITKFLTAARAGRPLAVYGDGSQSRDFVHVADVAEANFAAATKPAGLVAGAAFNIGAGASVSVNDLVRLVRRRFAEAGDPIHEPARPGEIRHSLADISHARELLGFAPRGRLEDFILTAA